MANIGHERNHMSCCGSPVLTPTDQFVGWIHVLEKSATARTVKPASAMAGAPGCRPLSLLTRAAGLPCAAGASLDRCALVGARPPVHQDGVLAGDLMGRPWRATLLAHAKFVTTHPNPARGFEVPN